MKFLKIRNFIAAALIAAAPVMAQDKPAAAPAAPQAPAEKPAEEPEEEIPAEEMPTEETPAEEVPTEELPAEEEPEAAEMVEPAATPDRKRKRGLGDYIYFDALPIALMGILESSMFMIVNTLTLTVSVIRDLPEMSLFFVVYVIVSFCMRPIMGKLYDRYGFSKVCPPMCILMTLSMLTFAFTDGIVMIVVDGVLFALGQGCLWPCLQAESVRGVPEDKSGLSTNTLLFGVDLGMVVGPMVGGAILDVAGPMWMYLFATGVGILLTLWTIPYIRIMNKREAQQRQQD